LIAKHNPADIAALGALPCSQDGFGPTLEDVRKGLIGKIGENMSLSAASSGLPRAPNWRATCTARASVW
jgi:translation elongation factor EF-Ts